MPAHNCPSAPCRARCLPPAAAAGASAAPPLVARACSCPPLHAPPAGGLHLLPLQGSKRDWHGRTLCFAGQEAAAAAKAGRPLDLRCVGARIDAGTRCCEGAQAAQPLVPNAETHTPFSSPPCAPAGVYNALPDPLTAFAADVKYVCSLYQVGRTSRRADWRIAWPSGSPG